MPSYIQAQNHYAWQFWVDEQHRLATTNGTMRYVWNTWQSTVTNSGTTAYRVATPAGNDWDTWGAWNYNQTTTYRTAGTVWSEWITNYADGEGWQPGYNAPLAPRDVAAMDAEAFQQRFQAGLPRERFGAGFGGLVRQRTEDEWTAIREEQERQRAARDATQREAREEARKLMRVVLSAEQMASYEKHGFFEVVGSEGGVFRIYHGTSGNLKQVVNGREINALCVHPRLVDHRTDEGEGYGYLPTEDSMIAQAFALMHDELGTVMKANVHRGQRHLRAVPAAA